MGGWVGVAGPGEGVGGVRECLEGTWGRPRPRGGCGGTVCPGVGRPRGVQHHQGEGNRLLGGSAGPRGAAGPLAAGLGEAGPCGGVGPLQELFGHIEFKPVLSLNR